MCPYIEGPNDTILWTPPDDRMNGGAGKSDMLTDWWA
jgi:hypothetical protein